MRKILGVAAAVLTAAAIAGCGKGSTTTATEAVSETKLETTVAAETAADGTEAEKTAETEKEELNFESFVAIDNDECRVTIKDIAPDKKWGYAVNVELENKSADKTYNFSVTDAAVDGLMCSPLFSKEVTAGKKANGSIDLAIDSLQEYGLQDETDLELFFRISDADDWSADPVAETSVHVYPYGEEQATTFVRQAKATDQVLLDNEYLSVTLTEIYHDSIWGYSLGLYVVNKSDSNIMVSVDDASVNGYMLDPFFANEILAGKTGFTSVSWSDSSFEENGIETVENIEFTLKAYDYDSWSTRFAEEPVVITP